MIKIQNCQNSELISPLSVKFFSKFELSVLHQEFLSGFRKCIETWFLPWTYFGSYKLHKFVWLFGVLWRCRWRCFPSSLHGKTNIIRNPVIIVLHRHSLNYTALYNCTVKQATIFTAKVRDKTIIMSRNMTLRLTSHYRQHLALRDYYSIFNVNQTIISDIQISITL